MTQREIEQIFELLGLSAAPGPCRPLVVPPPSAPPDYYRAVFIAAESTSQASEPEQDAQLERDPQRDQGSR